jgi:hypothetical protein
LHGKNLAAKEEQREGKRGDGKRMKRHELLKLKK